MCGMGAEADKKGVLAYMNVGEVTRSEYLKVTVPLIISAASQPLLGAANTALMGNQPDASYLAAFSLGIIFLNNAFWLFGFLRAAATSLASQAAGRNSPQDAFAALACPLAMALGLGILFLCFYPLLFYWYAAFMRIEGREMELLGQFLDWAVPCAPFVFMNYALIGWMMGQRMVRQTMLVQVSMNVLNILLAVMATAVWEAGIRGLALAMAAAQVYGFAAGMSAVLRSRRLRPDCADLAEALSLSSFKPLLVMQANLLIRTACLLTINNLFARAGNSMGVEYMAANAILLEMIYVISFVIDGMANGVSVFAGQSWGAGSKKALLGAVRTGLQVWSIFAVLCSVFVLWHGWALLEFMTDQAELLSLAGAYLPYLAVHPLTAGTGLLLYGVYTAVGCTSYIRNMMLLAALLFFILQLVLLPLAGNHGIWLAYVLTYLFESAAYAWGMKYLMQRMLPLKNV